MAGTFSKTTLPKRPGAYVNYVGQKAEPALDANILGVVAIPFAHTWGPENTPVTLGSWSEFLTKFTQGGTDTTSVNADRKAPAYTDGYIAVKQAFEGENYNERFGAAQVIAYRLVPSGAAKATLTLTATSGSALVLTAKYKGTYGNRLKVAVVTNAADSSQRDIVIYDNVTSAEVERYTTTGGNVVADFTVIRDAINKSSNWLTAALPGTVGTGGFVSVAVSSAAALTGGTDGTVAQADYTAAMTALEPMRFSLFAPANLTDQTTMNALVTWAAGLNAKGKRFISVFGGAGSYTASSSTYNSVDTLATSNTRAAAINTNGNNDPNFINLGIGVYLDSELGILNTAQLAPRIAGILADRAEYQSMTFARLSGLTIENGAPTESQILSAIANGTVVVARDSNRTAPLRIEKSVTTYISTTNTDRPFAIYSVPKFLRTMHGVEMEITEWAEGNVIGRFPVNEATRNYVIAEMTKRLQAREQAGVIQSGWTVTVDSNPSPTATDEFVAVAYSLTFGRSLEQVLNTIVVG